MISKAVVVREGEYKYRLSKNAFEIKRSAT